MGTKLSFIALCASVANVHAICKGKRPIYNEFCRRYERDEFKCHTSPRAEVLRKCEWIPTISEWLEQPEETLKDIYYKVERSGNPGNWVRMTDDVYFAYIKLLNVIMAPDAEGTYRDPMPIAEDLVTALKDEALIFGIRKSKTTAEAARETLIAQWYDPGNRKALIAAALKKVPVVGQFSSYALAAVNWFTKVGNYFEKKRLKALRLAAKESRKVKIEPYSFYLYENYQSIKFRQCQRWMRPRLDRDGLAIMNALPRKTFGGELTEYTEPKHLGTFMERHPKQEAAIALMMKKRHEARLKREAGETSDEREMREHWQKKREMRQHWKKREKVLESLKSAVPKTEPHTPPY